MYYGYPNYGYGNSCGCQGGNIGYIYPNYGCNNSNYAIIIVLFILLVIIVTYFSYFNNYLCLIT